jgi:hypothetical protein
MIGYKEKKIKLNYRIHFFIQHKQNIVSRAETNRKLYVMNGLINYNIKNIEKKSSLVPDLKEQILHFF